MARPTVGTIVAYLRRVVRPPEDAAATDGALLERFVAGRDEVAFECLVHRHGPMVLGVCRRVLGDPHEAEDAFQATFLVLVKKAASIGRRELLAHWLYRVAYRTARKARANRARRGARASEYRSEPMSPPDPLADVMRMDLRGVLDEELQRLPAKYRAPLVLCYLEGKTSREACRLLGWTEGTLWGRMARARELLRGRLARRHVSLSAALLTTALAQTAAPAAVPAALVSSTVRAAVGGALSVQPACLARQVVAGMALARLKSVAVVLLVAGGIVGGTAGTYHATTEKPMAHPTTLLDRPPGPPAQAPPKAVNLAGRNLTGAILMRSRLRGGDLREANLCRAVLTGADLSGADLRGTILVTASLQGADLRGAKLAGADLANALYDPETRWPDGFIPEEHGAVFFASGRDLAGKDFSGRNLTGAILSQANLRGARLRRADLSRALLTGADLTDADLAGAVLAVASLQGTDLSRANLTGTDLSRAVNS